MTDIKDHNVVVLELSEIDCCVVTRNGDAMAPSTTLGGKECVWQFSQVTLTAELAT